MQPRLLKHPARLAGASLLRLQDDQRLVALAREGHDPAFAAIVDRYGRQLERYCARLLGPGRAEDAVQQAFVNAHAAMRASETELALKPWLYRIAHNAALNILRAARDEEEVLGDERAGAFQTAEIVELRERLRETLATIQTLPAVQRDALLLRELEGRSHEEIAAALGVTEGGARQHLHRARVSLRAAASAITPYPVLARVLGAAAAEGGRGADIVSGAGMGAGAGALKVAAGVLAAGAIAGGAVGVQHHKTRSPIADRSATSRSTTAPSEGNGPSAPPLQVADHQSAGATASHGHSRSRGGARGRRGRGPSRSGVLTIGHRSGSGHDDHHGSSGGGTGEHSGSGEHTSSHEGSGTSGGSGGSGSDDTTTDASHDGSGGGSTTTTPTTTSTDGGSTSGSDGGSSGSTDGGTITTTTTTDGSSGGDGSLSGGSGDPVSTIDH